MTATSVTTAGGARQRRGNAVRGVTWVAAGHVVSQLAWLGSLVIVASLIPPHAFGSVSIAMVVVQAAWLLVGSGTRGALVVSGTLTRGEIRRAFAVNVASGFGAAVLAALLAVPVLESLAPGGDPLVLQGLALSIALFGFSIVPLALLQREMRFGNHAAANAGAALIASGVAIATAYAGLGLWALVLRQILFQGLLALFAWAGARSLVPPARLTDPPARRNPVAWWFFALAAASFASLNIDNVLVGRLAGVAQLGLYSLAFTLAFAPVTQFAWQVGKVLFSLAARTDDPEAMAARAARAARLAALLVWPAVPPAMALAPVVLPRLLGPAWHEITLPFQLLLVVGAVHAVLAVLREFLLGGGHVRPCFVVDLGWLAGVAVALVALVPAYGITGAALAHVTVLVPLTCAYVWLAARRVGVEPRVFWRAIRLVAVGVAVEGAMTLLEYELMRWAGATPGFAALGGAATGLVALLLMFSGAESPPHRELLELFRAARASAPAGAGALPSGAGIAAEPAAAISVPADETVAPPSPRFERPAAPSPTFDRPAPSSPTFDGAAPSSPTFDRPAPSSPTFDRPAPPSPTFDRSAPPSPTYDRLAPRVAMVAFVLAATVCGAVASREPRLAAAVIAVSGALLLAHRAPVMHLLVLLAITTAVPLEIQARFGSGGSIESAGILPSDLLLLSGLARALVVLPRTPLARFSTGVGALTLAFLGVAVAQLVHALALGRPISGAGGEFRALLAFATLFVALPILADASQRRRLMTGLAWLGLTLGCWGCAQFALHLRFMDVDAPLDQFQTAGRVVGLFAFPAAATLALGALTEGSIRRPGARMLLAAVVISNVVAVVLTFERTFIVVTLVGFALVFLRGTPRQRVRLALVAPGVAATTVLGLGVLAPAALSAYGQRLATLTQASADPAVQYRVAESRMVESEIRARPVSGSGLGATILIGRPGTNTPPAPRRHAENGYLWLAWKTGIPAALLMCLVLAAAVAGPRVRTEPRGATSIRRGCQAALATIVVATLTFPSFNQTGITAAMGVLIAVSVAADPASWRLPRAGAAA